MKQPPTKSQSSDTAKAVNDDDAFREAVITRFERLVAAKARPEPDPPPTQPKSDDERRLEQAIRVYVWLTERLEGWTRFLGRQRQEADDLGRKHRGRGEWRILRTIDDLGARRQRLRKAMTGKTPKRLQMATEEVMVHAVQDWIDADRNDAMGDDVASLLTHVAGCPVDLGRLDRDAKDARGGNSGTRHAQAMVRLALGSKT